MGRFAVVEAPNLQPAFDYVTGNAVGPFIDTGKDIIGPGGRVMGRLYLSKDTVEEFARELGLLGPQTNSHLIDAAYHRGKVDALKEELGGDLHHVTAVLGRWLDHLRSDDAAAEGEDSHE